MNNKLVLTSAVVFGFMCPAFATPSHTSNTFPSNGLMEADYTYTGQATYDNIGAYGGDVVAEAEYEFIDYNLDPGQYLPQSSTTVTQCTTGNFCTGIGNVHYDTTTDQGITACSTLGDHSYTLSAAGASAETDCYKACATSMVSHATAVTGNDYYGAGVDTCSATACENGYHTVDTFIPNGNNPNLTTLIGVTEAGTAYAVVGSNNGTATYPNSVNISDYGLTTNDHSAFAVDYGANKGMIRGHGRCSTLSGTNPWSNSTYSVIDGNIVDTLTDETGQTNADSCYCQLDSYTNGQTTQNMSAPWVLYHDFDSSEMCAIACILYCAGALQRDTAIDLSFRAAVFGSLGATLATCDANTITIRWGDTDDADVTANNAGTATYGSDIRTPVKAQTKPGKTFKGWRFSAPAQSGS